MRIMLEVEVNLDPVPGAFNQPEDFEQHIYRMLNDVFPWYMPTVTLKGEVK
jgi:hypothetical protein